MATMSLQLKQAIALAKAGQDDQARLLVEKTIEEEPENANAWLLLSTLAKTQEEQVQSLNRVLSIDPDNDLARKRLSKIAPILPGEETDEVGALFRDESVVAEIDDMTDEVSDELPATVVTAAPPALDDADVEQDRGPEGLAEKSADEVGDESLAGRADTPDLESPDDVQLAAEREHHDDGLETIISPVVIDGTEKDAEEAEEGGVQEVAEPTQETMVSSVPGPPEQAIVDELQPKSSIEETAEVPDEDLEGLVSIGEPSVDLPDLDDIPDWLRDEGGYAEPGTELRIAPAPEDKPEEESSYEEIPGWLQEGPGEEWLEKSEARSHDKAVDTSREDERVLRATVAGAVEPGEAEDLEEPLRGRTPRLSTRTLEIVLAVLIILALLIVAALAYVVVYLG